MQSQFPDIRNDLKDRMNETQREIERLTNERAKIDEKLQSAASKLAALRAVHLIEDERFGPSLSLYAKGEKSYRFAGMNLTTALRVIRNEQPEISKKKAKVILENEGFDFRGKNHGQAVHFAWVVLERSKKKQ